MSVTTVKTRIWQILKNPMYRGGQSQRQRGDTIIFNSNNYPQIIDDETWELCAKKRSENRYEVHAKNEYLLSRIIRCKCGASYSVNLVDGCYNCRVKHNGVEKGIEHSPNINANTIESLAWHVALLELQGDNAVKCKEVEAKNEKSIEVIETKIKYSQEIINKLLKRREQLDNDYYVTGVMSEDRYKELTEGQNKVIAEEKSNINRYNSQIDFLSEQIENAITFDEMFDSLKGRYESLRSGTDSETMRSVIRRYIKNITIEPREGKLTSHWKVVKIELFDSENREALIQTYKEKGLDMIAMTLGTTFYIDCYHHIAYWDEDSKFPVDMVMLDRVHKTRLENRKGRKRKPTKNHQY